MPDGPRFQPSGPCPLRVTALRVSIAIAGRQVSRKETRTILRRLDKAREGLFPEKTCPASRHVHLIVEGLLEPNEGYGRDLARLGYEPDHMAGSIASVLEGLWRARRWMRWVAVDENDYRKGGEWMPDLEAIAAQGTETAKPPKRKAGSARKGERPVPQGCAQTSVETPESNHE